MKSNLFSNDTVHKLQIGSHYRASNYGVNHKSLVSQKNINDVLHILYCNGQYGTDATEQQSALKESMAWITIMWKKTGL